MAAQNRTAYIEIGGLGSFEKRYYGYSMKGRVGEEEAFFDISYQFPDNGIVKKINDILQNAAESRPLERLGIKYLPYEDVPSDVKVQGKLFLRESGEFRDYAVIRATDLSKK